MMLTVPAILGLVLAFAPLAPATPMPADGVPIPPIVWELIEMPGDGAQPVEIAEPNRYTIQFLPDGTLGIGADCNRVTGVYEIDDDSLSIELGISTLAMCPPDSQANKFTIALESVTSYSFDDDGHLLLESDSGTLQFTAALHGVVWEWQEFQGSDDSVIAPRNPADYSLTFLPDGKLGIKADCNRARGTYAAEGGSLDLIVGGVTRMLCPEGSLMDAFLRDLDAATSLVFRDGKLFLALPMDAGIMAFEAKYVAPDAATPTAG